MVSVSARDMIVLIVLLRMHFKMFEVAQGGMNGPLS